MNAEVLFIHPGNHKKNYQDLAKEFTAIATPAWTLLLANYMRINGISTAIYDVNVEGWDGSVIKELAAKYSPKLVVLMVYGHNPSASTQTMPAAIKIIKDIKKFNSEIPVAVGGIHPSALPERTLNETGADYIIQGEGAYTLLGLAKMLQGRGEIGKISGLWFKEKGAPKFTSPPMVIADLDGELPDYAWDLLPDLNNYRAHNMHCFQDFNKSKMPDFSDIRSPYVAMNTSLGCPYNCSYCCINAIFGKPGIRYWSPERVVGWFAELADKYKIKNIRLDDELFILDPKRVEKICDLIIERQLDLNLWVYGRVDTIKDSLLKKMKRVGINWICLGIESGNEHVRNNVNKNIRKDIRQVVKSIQANGIYVLGNYMLGLPEDDLRTMEETLQLAIELNCEFANIYAVMAYPGSQLYLWSAKQKGHIPDKWEAFSQHGFETQPLPTRHLTAEQVLRFRDEAFVRCLNNDRFLGMITEKFGDKTRDHLEKMLKIRVKRRILGDS